MVSTSSCWFVFAEFMPYCVRFYRALVVWRRLWRQFRGIAMPVCYPWGLLPRPISCYMSFGEQSDILSLSSLLWCLVCCQRYTQAKSITCKYSHVVWPLEVVQIVFDAPQKKVLFLCVTFVVCVLVGYCPLTVGFLFAFPHQICATNHGHQSQSTRNIRWDKRRATQTGKSTKPDPRWNECRICD